MTAHRSISMRDIHWGFLAQGLNVAAGILLLPLVLRYLLPEEVGLWFVFITLAGLAQLLELGFQPTIARNVAYIYAGAQKLEGYGYIPAIGDTPLNAELLQQLFISARKIYFGVSVAALVTLSGVGSAYLMSILPPTMSPSHVIPAWLIFALGYVVNFYYGYFNAFLQGRGDVTEANKIVVVSRLAMVIIGSVLLVGGFGLTGLGFASLASSVISRMLARRFYWRDGLVKMPAIKMTKGSEKNISLVPILWPNAKRLGWVFLGSFLITRANILIASSFIGLKEAGSYGLTFQILLTLVGLSGVILNLSMPRLNADQVRGRQERASVNFGRALATGWLVFFLGATALVLCGSTLLAVIGSRTHLLDTDLLLIFIVIMFLEMNHSLCANYLTTFNEVLFVRAALVSGLAIVMFSALLVIVFHLGAWGLVISQGAVQVAYNNWKWPREAARRMNHSFAYVVTSGFTGLWKARHG